MRTLIAPAVLLVVAASCSEDDTYITITVDSRPTVHDARSLTVTLTNDGSTKTDELELGERSFPVTFTVSATGRTGDLGITIDALDGAGTLVGRGAGITPVEALSATVTLDSADFVVNTDYAMDQFLSSDFEAVGFQLAATSNGQWTAIFRDECTGSTSCDILGRRFDANGLPVFSQLAAGDIQFKLTTEATTAAATPAIAASGLNTIALWDYTDSAVSTRGIACRAITDTGAALGDQLSIANEDTDVVSAAPLVDGNFAVTWQSFITGTPSNYYTRAAIVRSDCSTATAPVSLSVASIGTFGAGRPHVTSNGQAILYAWITDDDLWVRTSTLTGALGQEKRIIAKTAGQNVEHVRLSPWRDGFAIAVRWASTTSDGPGKIELYFATNLGDLMGQPILITDESRSESTSNRGFSIARNPSDAIFVVWHTCERAGACDVFGRMVRPTGAPVGEPFVIPTSTASEQVNPSVVSLGTTFVAAWNDSSGGAPDRDGTSVRARVLTPLYDDARAVHGATCGASAPGSPDCGEGLACAMGTDGVERCYYECTGTCPRGGTCSSGACTF